MKRGGATKEEVIRATQELIARNGIRAVRVDEIALTLGISKRTLYEMFADKTDLVEACLIEMERQNNRRLLTSNRRRSGNALQKLFVLMRLYNEALFKVGSRFLADIRLKDHFARHYDASRALWHSQLAAQFGRCIVEGFLLEEIHAEVFADRIMTTLFELRMKQAHPEELHSFCRMILRGAATRRGIEWIDSH